MEHAIAVLIVLAIVLGLYFLPTIVAGTTGNPRWPAILIVNLLVGWTFLGWVICLVWAFCKPVANNQTVTIIQQFGDASEVDARQPVPGRRIVLRPRADD
jgi:uncharacterized membrane protein